MDILTGSPIWPLPAFPCLAADRLPREVEIAVIGGGVTGAFAARELVRAGHEVILLDRAAPAGGSTHACTAIIQYDLDVALEDLIGRIGRDAAEHVTLRCREAVESVRELCRAMPAAVSCFERASIYLASRAEDVDEIRTEYSLRRSFGLAAELMSEREISERYPWRAPIALVNPQGLELDPVALTLSLLEAAVGHGLRVYSPVEVSSIEHDGTAVTINRTGGAPIRCGRLVVAAGYETWRWLPKGVGRLTSTYAAATPPGQIVSGWIDRELVWESARPYHYLRRTADDRVIIGGRDKPFRNALLRDLLLPLERYHLRNKLRSMLADRRVKLDHAWCGTFAESDDGLPYLGILPDDPRVFYLFASGGNGVVFSALAPQLIRAWLAGTPDRLLELFAIGRG